MQEKENWGLLWKTTNYLRIIWQKLNKQGSQMEMLYLKSLR